MEKVTIPKFVAEYIEKWKGCLPLNLVLEYSQNQREKDIMQWLYDDMKSMNEQHILLFTRAWVDGYEIEKEKLYNVIMPSRTKVYKYHALGIDGMITKTNELSEKYQLTEKQIKAIDPRFMAFAKEVK